MDTRRISPTELEVMRAWLAHDVAGATALRAQLADHTEVFRSCEYGCASIGFVAADNGTQPGVSIFEVDAEIVDDHGNSVGGMMLTVRNGRLHDVDVFSWFDELPFPTIEHVRWHLRSNRAG